MTYCSRVTDTERKVQSLTATNEQLVAELKSSNDEHEKEKEALTNKLEERDNDCRALIATTNEHIREFDKNLLKYNKIAEDTTSFEANLMTELRSIQFYCVLSRIVFIFILVVLFIVVFVLDYLKVTYFHR